MTAMLRPGGLFIASTRDYDALVRERPALTPVRVLGGSHGRRIVFQMWDWHASGRSYRVHQFILQDAKTEWQTSHFETDYRALLSEELTQQLGEAGLANIRWYSPEESGYYQPLVTARKP
jgi:glycine/sarcosine N-methyltransferase